MKKASKTTQGNAFTSLQGSVEHRDAQRLQAAKEGLPSWTLNERDVTYVKGDDDHRILLRFRCSGCDKKVRNYFRYKLDERYAVMVGRMVDWVQEKHGSCNAGMQCEEIQAECEAVVVEVL